MPSKLGIMQGRLSPPIGDRIQAFPQDNWMGEFRLCKSLGLQCVEWIFEFEGCNNNPLMTPTGIEEISKLRDATSVSVSSVVADYFMVKRLFGDDESMIKNSIEVLYNLIDQSVKVGIPIIELPFVDASAIKTPDEMDQVRRTLRGPIAYANDRDVLITLETSLPPKTFNELILSFGLPNVRVNYDMGNSASLGYNPSEEIGLLGSHIANVHIKDRVLGGGTVPLGMGDTDFNVVFSELRRIGYSGDFILQTARRDLSFLKEDIHYEETIKGYLSFIQPFIETFR